MVLVVEAFEGLVALDAGEDPGVAALRLAVPVDLVLFERGPARLADKHCHFIYF